MSHRILVADDNPSIAKQIRAILAADGLEIETVGDAMSALEAMRSRPFHLLITDLCMPSMDGIELLARVRAAKVPLGVVLLTGYGDTEVALAAMKAGADDFLTKPFEPDQLRLLVMRVIERRRLIDELEQLRLQLRAHYSFHDMVSKSPKMRKVFDLIERVGPLNSTVLVHGETGTGKELVARAIHSASNREGRPFIAVNCAAIVDSLLESELFGHERGAFTGAEKRKLGRFELAHQGTLLLDEIGDLSQALQAKLLRALQSGSIERLGGEQSIQVDVRVVAATNKRLDAEVKAGRFRADLYYRLNVVRIELPPLRERSEDIPLLATQFLHRLESDRTPPVVEIEAHAMQALVAYLWPGNIRELENAIRGAIALSDGSIITRDALPPHIVPRVGRLGPQRPTLDIDRPLAELSADLIARVERDYFSQLLARYRGNIARCARHSRLSRRGVTQKLIKLDLDHSEFRRGQPRKHIKEATHP